jgi:hypothetical protein
MSDRNFYDRYYFNMHAQRQLVSDHRPRSVPEPGVTDAFITVSIGQEQHTVRASRELGSDRMDTTIGPLGVEVIQGLKKLRIRCDDNEWGVSADLTFTGVVEALEEPHTFSRRYGRIIQDVTRYAQIGVWEGRLTAAGRVRGDARPVEGRARPLGASARWASPRRPASRPARAWTATGSATTGSRCSSTTACSRSRSTRTPTATGISRRPCGLVLDQNRPLEHGHA